MREPEAEAALRAVERLALLHEQVEDARQHLRRDADAGVAHAQDDRRSPSRAARDGDACRRGSVYLAALVSRLATTCARRTGVAVDGEAAGAARRRSSWWLPLLEQRARHLDRLGDDLGQLDRLALELDLAARDARDVEQIVDQADQVAGPGAR